MTRTCGSTGCARTRTTQPSSLALFEGLRRANLDLWARTPVAARGRVGMHRERGPESYELTTLLSAGHDRVHMAQARRGLARLQADGAAHRPLTTSSSRGASLSTSGPCSTADHDVLDAHAVATLEIDARLDAERIADDER